MMGLLDRSLTGVESLAANAAHTQKKVSGETGIGVSPLGAPVSETGGASSSTTSSATISANDFLSLLVTELQNQDPTASTDPNEYINQLVQVNSLEQLIAINQDLTPASGGSGSGTSPSPGISNGAAASPSIQSASGVTTPVPGLAATGTTAAGQRVSALPATGSAGSGAAAAISRFAQSVRGNQAPGNLAIPVAHPAATTVARALNGHPVRGRLAQFQGTP